MESSTHRHGTRQAGHSDDVGTSGEGIKRLRTLDWRGGRDGFGGGGESEGEYEDEEEEEDDDDGDADGEAGDQTFPTETEFNFASVVFELGLRHASPKVIMTLMNAPPATKLTTEHIKSHLQKFRQV
jgi:SHAQKYF class myb-like DNA-binding protein